MKKRTTRKQLVQHERAEEFGREEWMSAAERNFIPFPLVPIEEGDPLLYTDSCCRCGCLRMPRKLEGGFCLHCGHNYQVGDPDFLNTVEEHTAHCMAFQEYAHPGSRMLPARCGAPAPCSSLQQLDALDEALDRLHRVVTAVYNYNLVERSALEGKPIEFLRQQALKSLSEYVPKERG
jgi:hypothetical protein